MTSQAERKLKALLAISILAASVVVPAIASAQEFHFRSPIPGVKATVATETEAEQEEESSAFAIDLTELNGNYVDFPGYLTIFDQSYMPINSEFAGYTVTLEMDISSNEEIEIDYDYTINYGDVHYNYLYGVGTEHSLLDLIGEYDGSGYYDFEIYFSMNDTTGSQSYSITNAQLVFSP